MDLWGENLGRRCQYRYLHVESVGPVCVCVCSVCVCVRCLCVYVVFVCERAHTWQGEEIFVCV